MRLSSNHRPPDSFFYSYEATSGVNVALADGSVWYLRTDNLSAERVRQILEIGGFTDDAIASQSDLSAGKRLNWPNVAALAVWFVSVGALLSAAVRGRKARLAPPPDKGAAANMTQATLDNSLRQAVDAGMPVEVVDPDTKRTYYLITSEQFQRMNAFLSGEFNPRDFYPVIDRVMAEDDALDPLLESYQ